jgi:molecular chaperone DnaK
VRHNDKVGGFLLEGLADVERGNEILVRFDLDLDGILKVSAVERATGLQKRLTIDNAVSRFRARNRQEAMDHVAAVFHAATGAVPSAGTGEAAVAAALPAEVPAELAPLVERCQRLIAKSQQIAPQANPTDAEAMRQLADRLRGAIGRRSQADMENIAAELDDLVFYLQDA